MFIRPGSIEDDSFRQLKELVNAIDLKHCPYYELTERMTGKLKLSFTVGDAQPFCVEVSLPFDLGNADKDVREQLYAAVSDSLQDAREWVMRHVRKETGEALSEKELAAVADAVARAVFVWAENVIVPAAVWALAEDGMRA